MSKPAKWVLSALIIHIISWGLFWLSGSPLERGFAAAFVELYALLFSGIVIKWFYDC